MAGKPFLAMMLSPQWPSVNIPLWLSRGETVLQRLRNEPVADPRLGNQITGVRGVRLQLPAERGDVDAHCVLRGRHRIGPDILDDLLEEQRLARVGREQLQQR